MFCNRCGARAEDGAHFCQDCGAPLQVPGGITREPYTPAVPARTRRSGTAKPQDPYKQQIQQLKLEIRQLKLDLKQITTQMSSTRSRYPVLRVFPVIQVNSEALRGVSGCLTTLPNIAKITVLQCVHKSHMFMWSSSPFLAGETTPQQPIRLTRYLHEYYQVPIDFSSSSRGRSIGPYG